MRPGTPRALFTNNMVITGSDITADGERLLVSVAAERPRPAVRLLLNWTGLLPR